MFFSHLECSRPCGAGPFDPRERHHLCTCGAPLLARYDLDAARSWKRETLARSRADALALSRAAAALPGESPVTLGEGFTPLIHASTARRGARPVAALRQGRVAQSDEFVQGARPVDGRDPCPRPRRTTLSVPTAGNAGCAMAAYAARAGLEAQVFMPRDVKRPFVDECALYGATMDAGGRPDHRRRTYRRRAGRAARLVRRLDAEGAVSHRRQEDDGVRAGRAARVALARLDHLSHRRRHRPDRHVEGIRRDGGDRLGAAATPAAHGLGAGGRLRADRPRVSKPAAITRSLS